MGDFAAFRRAGEEVGTTIVIVTHDRTVSREARRTVPIRDGLRLPAAYTAEDNIQVWPDGSANAPGTGNENG